MGSNSSHRVALEVVQTKLALATAITTLDIPAITPHSRWCMEVATAALVSSLSDSREATTSRGTTEVEELSERWNLWKCWVTSLIF